MASSLQTAHLVPTVHSLAAESGAYVPRLERPIILADQQASTPRQLVMAQARSLQRDRQQQRSLGSAITNATCTQEIAATRFVLNDDSQLLPFPNARPVSG